jgi:isopentenyl diphosphate isomerase/L-lactate dehydrogenase-like FMN-dependent dehydrogenase
MDLIDVDEFEAAARDRLSQMVFDYFAGGSGDEWTLAENRRAFDRWVLRPRILADVSNVDTATTVLGQPVAFPILLAPTALQRMAHRDGELATARATAALGGLMVLSTISTFSLEQVAGAGVSRWFQLYVQRNRKLTAELVRRAADAGYVALVVTADAPYLGRRFRDERNRFALPPGIGLANFPGGTFPQVDGSGLAAYFRSELDPAVTWRDVAWLRELSDVPVVLKGVLTGEDAALAIEAGASGVVVSNHGGRQLDGVPASIDALPEVVDAVGGRAEVYMDGGVRRGTDVLKALALGARAVLIGRPYLWGLAVDGEAGVRRVLELLHEELSLAMALAGRPNLEAVDRSAVMPAPR